MTQYEQDRLKEYQYTMGVLSIGELNELIDAAERAATRCSPKSQPCVEHRMTALRCKRHRDLLLKDMQHQHATDTSPDPAPVGFDAPNVIPLRPTQAVIDPGVVVDIGTLLPSNPAWELTETGMRTLPVV